MACDHYHRWRDDLAHMRDLGVNAYRFSLAWPRILPRGRGALNTAGLDFYDALVDALLEAGITPFVTLYHWDLPQALQDRGGWASRETAEAFANYTIPVALRLGDRVKHWITHNEPWCASHLGHETGHHAPGHRDPTESLRVAHHLLLSHGWAADVLRRDCPEAEVGITLNLTPAEPASSSEADEDAARSFDGFFNRWFLDPIFRGRYPADAIADRVRQGHLRDEQLDFVLGGDMLTIAAPLDFLGVNYYSRVVLRAGEDGRPVGVPQVPESELTEMGWEVVPEGLTDLLLRLHRDYGDPRIFVTENGIALPDTVDEDGRVHDPRRVDFLRDHLAAIHRAREAGARVEGYFHWSLLDNFEWGHGYTKRFGLLHVDFATQRRIAKDSAHVYREIIARGHHAVDSASVLGGDAS